MGKVNSKISASEGAPPANPHPVIRGLVPAPIRAGADDERRKTSQRDSNTHVPRMPTKHEVFTS
jgi:hypothetical protein